MRDPNDSTEYESVQMWDDNVVDVRLESTARFVEHVVADMASMYREAGLELSLVHFGGDEVPRGCWGELADGDGGEQALFSSFMRRCAGIAARHGARLAGWEEVFLHQGPTHGGGDDPARGVCYVWNNIWGWGQEDAAYRLANAGTDVVLANATHLYFDLAHSRAPQEPGYYWAGTTSLSEVFDFRPYTYFEGLTEDRLGNPITQSDKASLTRLEPAAKSRVLGLQGHLWGENLNSPARLEYMAFPRLLALAERAWYGPASPSPGEPHDSPRSWDDFSNHLGRRELPRLDRDYGVRYRPIP